MIPRIAISGMGICSALGEGIRANADRLAEASSGLRPHVDLVDGLTMWAGLVENLAPRTPRRLAPSVRVDRTAELAIRAATEALGDAGLASGFGDVAPERVGLILGTSHGGRSQLDAYVQEGAGSADRAAAERVLVAAAHQSQTAAVAAELGIHGPVLTISSACSSSGAAIAYAAELVAESRADVVVAGGADAFAKLTAAGFHALGAMAEGPSSPFSNRIGLSLGEGAAFVVLETVEHAAQRGRPVRGELLGHGLSWDAHHLTEPDPTGAGLARAMARALGRAGLRPEEIDYVHAHGTGTRANDAAECLAVKRALGSRTPLSSTKSYTGHTLGASSAIGLVFSLVAMRRGFVPPTLSFESPRPGCDLDHVPNQPRRRPMRRFAVDSSGFGGTNAVLVAGEPDAAPRPRASARTRPLLAVTGVGVVSPVGLRATDYLAALRTGRSGVGPIRRFDVAGCRATRAALVDGFDARRLMPTLNARRLDVVVQYAAVAAREALDDARLLGGGAPSPAPEALGVVVGTSRGAIASYERYLQSVAGGEWRLASATHFPNLVMSSLGGQVSIALGLRGISSTVVGGTTAGLQALLHALELFRHDETQDALVVVAADRVEPLFFHLYDRLGVLAADGREPLAPYAAESAGAFLGEGAVALVVERAGRARERGAREYAHVAGHGITHDAAPDARLDREGRWLERAMRLALEEAQVDPGALDAAYGHGRGDRRNDEREVAALERVLGSHPVPVGCVMGSTGLAEAASGLFSVAAAALGTASGEVYPIAGGGELAGRLRFVRAGVERRELRHTLVAGSTEDGGNAALLLARAGGA